KIPGPVPSRPERAGMGREGLREEFVRREKRSGQVVVEMLLILPVFMTIVFIIMEIGYLSFQLIMLNHATYEVARIGGMTFAPPPGHACGQLRGFMQQVLPGATCE